MRQPERVQWRLALPHEPRAAARAGLGLLLVPLAPHGRPGLQQVHGGAHRDPLPHGELNTASKCPILKQNPSTFEISPKIAKITHIMSVSFSALLSAYRTPHNIRITINSIGALAPAHRVAAPHALRGPHAGQAWRNGRAALAEVQRLQRRPRDGLSLGKLLHEVRLRSKYRITDLAFSRK